MIAATFVASRVGAQRPDTTFYITMQGQDTVAVEYYRRNDNTITGAWIQNQGSVLVHDYALVLGDDGWPRQYVMTLDRPELRRTFLLSVTYGPDSATRIVVRDSVARTERVAALREYPSGARSILGVELALQRARQHADREITVCLAERPGPSTTLRPPSTDPRCSDFRSHFANRTAR